MTITITKYCETDPKKVLQNMLKYFEDYAKCPKAKIKPDFDSFERFTLHLKLNKAKTV